MKLHDKLDIDLSLIEKSLRNVIDSDPDVPRSSVIYSSIMGLIDSGGKRLRPIMTLIGGRFGEADRFPAVLRVASLLEYIHMASLVHDDVIDRSSLRRGQPTLHTLTNQQTAIHIGNYMIARAVEWATKESSQDKPNSSFRYAELAALVTELCLGEYEQLEHRFNFKMTLNEYINKTKRKTALLMANCFLAGAEEAEAEPTVARRLYEFGEALGIAFQIQDDLLDFTHSSSTIGKPVGADLRNGVITLPVLYALHNPVLAPQIRALHADSSAEEFDAVIQQIAASDAITQAETKAQTYIEQAEMIVDSLQGFPAARDLETLIAYFIR